MKILLTEWASRHYSPAPSLFTLRRWARDGEIYPPPEKAGKFWMVDERAVRVAHNAAPMDLLQRITA
jgi:predicted site-specific integrase-resolvase